MAANNKALDAPNRTAKRAAVLAARDAIVETFADPDDKKEFNGVVPRNEGGRPTVVTGEALPKLEYAFKIGCTDSEACLYAEISVAALQRHFKKHPEYRERTKGWKDDYLVMFSRGNIAAAITGQVPKGDVAISRDYLRSKRRDEFADKSIVEHQLGLTPAQVEERASRELAGRKEAIEGEIVAEDDHSPALPHSDVAAPVKPKKAKKAAPTQEGSGIAKTPFKAG